MAAAVSGRGRMAAVSDRGRMAVVARPLAAVASGPETWVEAVSGVLAATAAWAVSAHPAADVAAPRPAWSPCQLPAGL